MRLNLFRTIACAILSSLATVLFANDGGFYISGNHLVPISNNTVKVAKEKLTIQLNDNNQTYVDVDYVFVNSSSKAQTIKMGFEAKIEDSWAHVPEKANTGHPNIHDFKIEMNGKPVNFSNEYAFVLTNEKDSTKYLDYSHFPVDKSKWVLGGKDYHEIAEGAWDNGLQNKETKPHTPMSTTSRQLSSRAKTTFTTPTNTTKAAVSSMPLPWHTGSLLPHDGQAERLTISRSAFPFRRRQSISSCKVLLPEATTT